MRHHRIELGNIHHQRLLAQPQGFNLFQAISHNPRLMKQGLLINPESLSPTELQQCAWAVAAPAIRHRTSNADARGASFMIGFPLVKDAKGRLTAFAGGC